MYGIIPIHPWVPEEFGRRNWPAPWMWLPVRRRLCQAKLSQLFGDFLTGLGGACPPATEPEITTILVGTMGSV